MPVLTQCPSIRECPPAWSTTLALARPNENDTWWPEDLATEDGAAEDLQPYLTRHQGNITSSSSMWCAAGLGHFCGAADGPSHAPQIYSSPTPRGTHLFGHTGARTGQCGGPRALSPSHPRTSRVTQSCAPCPGKSQHHGPRPGW